MYQIYLNYLLFVLYYVTADGLVRNLSQNLMDPKHSSVTQISVYPAHVLCTQLSCGITMKDSAPDFVHPQVLMLLFCMLFPVIEHFCVGAIDHSALQPCISFPLLTEQDSVFCVNHSRVALLIILYTLTEMLNKVVSAIKSGYNHWVQSNMVFPRIGFHFHQYFVNDI